MTLRRAVADVRLGPLLATLATATGVPLGLTDPDGHWVVSAGWPHVCTALHRACPDTAARCRESDREFAAGLSPHGYAEHRCALGLVKIAFPIVVDEELLGTCFTGFLRAPADPRRLQQAGGFGGDRDACLAALADVPVADDEHVGTLLAFLTQLMGVVGELIGEHAARLETETELRRVKQDLERTVETRTQELNAALEALAQEASHDHLTGLVNRRYLSESLEREIARARRSGSPLSVLLIDLDGLKDLNDRFGHGAGDRAILAVAATMAARIRTGDILGRWGGDEFCAILADTPLEGAMAVAERLRAGVAAGMPGTISVGLAEWGGESAGQLIHRADDALYLAKRDGRNRCRTHLRPAPGGAPGMPAPRAGHTAAAHRSAHRR